MLLCDAAQVVRRQALHPGRRVEHDRARPGALGGRAQDRRGLARGRARRTTGSCSSRTPTAGRSWWRRPTGPNRSRCAASSRVAQPPGIPEGSPIDVALAVNLGPLPLAARQPASPGACRSTASRWPAPRSGSPPAPGHGAGSRVTVLRPALRPVLRGLRARRRLPPLAGQDDHRVRRPPLLHDHDEPPSPAHQRVVRRARDGARQERRRRQPRLLARARDERARRERLVHRQPGGRVAVHRYPTFHGDTIYAETRVLDKTASKSKDDRGIVTVETKAFNQRGEEVCYFRRKVMVWKAAVGAGAAAPLRRRRLGLRPAAPGRPGPAFPAPCSWSGGRTPARPAVAPHPRSLAGPGERGDAPADPGRPRRAPLRAVPRRLPHSGGLRRGGARGRWSGCGRGSATTAGPSTCTGRRRPSWPSTAAWCRRGPRPCGAFPGVGPYTARAVRTFAFGRRRGRRRHQRRAGAGSRGGGRARSRCAAARRSRTRSCPPGDRGSSTRRCSTSAPPCAPRRDPTARAARCAGSAPGAVAGAGASPTRRLGPTARPQSTFAGSDRQGRGRLVDALRQGGVRPRRPGPSLRLARGPGAGPPGGRGLVAEGFAGGPAGGLPSSGCAEAGGRAGTPAAGVLRWRQEAEDVAVTTVGPLEVEEVAGAVDDHHREPSARTERGSHGVEAHAAVVAAVEVEGRLRRGQQWRRPARSASSGAVQRRVVERPVVADGGQDALGVADGLLDPRRRPTRRRSRATSRPRGGR